MMKLHVYKATLESLLAYFLLHGLPNPDKILIQLFSSEFQLELGYGSSGIETFGTGFGAYLV
jgi:hypothetical protein